MQNQPLVTVYIPTFNRVELLKRAVKSVQDQTYKNLEIIIVDDCSIDGTYEYLEQIAKEDKRIRYFLKEKNSGACVSRNIAIENAKGEFITGLDDDDYFLKSRIEDFVENYFVMKTDIQCSTYTELCSNGEVVNKNHRLDNINYKDLILENYIGNQIFINSIYKDEFKFNENVKVMQDLECWFNIILKTKQNIKCLNNNSYIIDKTHPHERITKNNKAEAKKTLDIIGKKLKWYECFILYQYLYGYNGKKSNIFFKTFRVCYRTYLNFFRG